MPKKGYKQPKSQREKASRIAKEKGFGKWMIGKKQSKETIEKRVSHFRGEKSYKWKGGISHTWRIKNAPRPKPEQCEICGVFGKDTKKGLCYDHNHKTNQFRGWLCSRCNLALGMINDDIEILEKMIKYLSYFEEKKDEK